jgi:hypothetical protein
LSRLRQLFRFLITGLFSVPSQLWEEKNPKDFPLLSVTSQLWEPGKRTICQQGITGCRGFGKRGHGIFLKLILAYNNSNVKEKDSPLWRAYYNLCRVHQALRVTPAVEAGLTDHVWTLGELLEAS